MSAALARLLVESRASGRRVGALPADLVPREDDAAYAVQEEVARLLGFAVAGWKVGSPNPTGPVSAAPLFAPLVAASPARFPAAADSFRAVEAELALKIGGDLPERKSPYTEDEAWAAIVSVHVAIEFLDSRYADRARMSAHTQLADNLTNGGFSYGAPVPLAAVDFLTAKVSLMLDGKEAKSAVGGNPAGHPKRLLGWLANHAASRGRALKKGDLVTTGSHTGITIAPLGAKVSARFAAIGEAELTLTSRG
jgi:2-keto-4-pentenoate hydratase